jgi:hypothetical protein
LLAIAAIAGVVAAIANIALAATGEVSWGEAIGSIIFAALGCVGLGGARGILGALKGGAGLLKGGLPALTAAFKAGAKSVKGAFAAIKSLGARSRLPRFGNPAAGPHAPRGGRGLSKFGGVIEETSTNAAGGRLFTSAGNIEQFDIDSIVQLALMRGDDVHVITGVHGLPGGTTIPHPAFYADDIAQYGCLDGVFIHDLPAMTLPGLKAILDGPGTIIGAFCNSGECLTAIVGSIV